MTISPPHNAFTWPDGARCAISLTFDDTRPSQLDAGLPVLDRFGVKGTFYVSLPALNSRLDDWRRAAASGHELGNHTMTHPCSGNFGFMRHGGNALEDYTLARMAAELTDANRHIAEQTGVRARTFAYPCGQTFVGRGRGVQSYVPLVAEHFLAGRCFHIESHNDPAFCDPAQLFGIDGDGLTAAAALAWIKRAHDEGGWLIFVFHNVREKAAQAVSPTTLAAICAFAAEPANGARIDTVAAIAQLVTERRREPCA